MRFAFITDTHLGGDDTGWHQLPRWDAGLPILFTRLKQFLGREKIEWILHGGDLTEHGTPTQIDAALKLLESLDRPSLICLGNHDLMIGVDAWHDAVAKFDRVKLADAAIDVGPCDLIAMNNHWIDVNRPKLFWNPVALPDPCLTSEQLHFLESSLARSPKKPAIVMFHAPVDALPTDLTGRAEPYIESPPEYCRSVFEVLDRHPRPTVLLTGHSHVNHIARHPSRIHVSSTAMNEIPFMIRAIEVTDGGKISVSTQSLREDSDPIEIDPAKAWVMGRSLDQSAEM